MLCERNQVQSHNTVGFHLYETPRIGKFREKIDQKLPGAGGGDHGKLLLNGQSFFWSDNKVLGLYGGNSCMTLQV